MINLLSLIGAVGLSTVMGLQGIQPKESILNEQAIIIGGTDGWDCWTDDTDYRFSFTLSSDSFFTTWKTDSASYTSNYYFHLEYFDFVNNVFRGYSDGSTTSNRNVVSCINNSYPMLEGGIKVGMFVYLSRSSSNPESCAYSIGFVSNYIGGASYYLSEEFYSSAFSNLTYRPYTVYVQFQGTVISSSPNNFIEPQTLSSYFSYVMDLPSIYKVSLHDSQVVSYLPLGACIYTHDFSNASVDLNLFNYTYTYQFTNSVNADKTKAYNEGYEIGLDEGTSVGYQTGYATGYDEGSNYDDNMLTIFHGIINVGLLPINVFLGMMNWELFGINIGGFVSSLITVALVAVVIKFVTGAFK